MKSHESSPCRSFASEMTATDQALIRQAGRIVSEADALLICAGAGMGVDSGLPDFRGREGFWNEYPAARQLGLSFEELANPEWFERDPSLAWGFYGHRHKLYRETEPHRGFGILARWALRKKSGCFVFTSNVDGQLQKAGFSEERCYECHGSLMHAQCARPCCSATWPLPGALDLQIDALTLRAAGNPPKCISCGGMARPNVLMFGDSTWCDGRSSAQQLRFRLWLRSLTRGKLAVLELGAGTAVPTVRSTAEQISQAAGTTLIRINPRDCPPSANVISLPFGAEQALSLMDEAIG